MSAKIAEPTLKVSMEPLCVSSSAAFRLGFSEMPDGCLAAVTLQKVEGQEATDGGRADHRLFNLEGTKWVR